MPHTNKTVVVLIKDDKIEAYSQLKKMMDVHTGITPKMVYFDWRNKYPVEFNGWKIHKLRINERLDEKD